MEHDQKNQLLEFYCPKIYKETARRSREKERERESSNFILQTQNCFNSFSLFHSIRGIQFCKGISTKNVWACSPRGTGREIKLKSQKLKTKSSSQFNSLWKMLKFGRVFTNLMQNSEITHSGWRSLNLAFRFPHCYCLVSGITSVTILF